jgi:lipoprotein-anchoring transpeptidase ErfK/SrfK
MKNNICSLLIFIGFLVLPGFASALEMPTQLQNKTADDLKIQDSDGDDLSDYDELYIFHTDPLGPDTDKDGWSDGTEVAAGYDPNAATDQKLIKTIDVSLSGQNLKYFLGNYLIGEFKISSGVPKLPTPKGNFSILKKTPLVTYGVKGGAYYYPNTKWNLLFKYQKKGNLYIHGAYWHNKFGQPMSHGCVNVSYNDMENLYSWADVGTKITIH